MARVGGPRSTSDAVRRLAWIQTQQLAQTFAMNARPTKPFELGTTNEYKLLKAKFDLIASTKGMDARAKLLELGNWFSGAPKLTIDAEAMDPDPERAYKSTRKELDILFGRNDDATTALIKSIKSGKEIGAKDRAAHVNLYAQLRASLATAKASGREREFDRQDIL